MLDIQVELIQKDFYLQFKHELPQLYSITLIIYISLFVYNII